MVTKKNSRFPKDPRLKPYHQIQFSVIPKSLFGEGSTPLERCRRCIIQLQSTFWHCIFTRRGSCYKCFHFSFFVVNLTVWLEFKLIYFKAPVHHFSHYATRLPNDLWLFERLAKKGKSADKRAIKIILYIWWSRCFIRFQDNVGCRFRLSKYFDFKQIKTRLTLT